MKVDILKRSFIRRIIRQYRPFLLLFLMAYNRLNLNRLHLSKSSKKCVIKLTQSIQNNIQTIGRALSVVWVLGALLSGVTLDQYFFLKALFAFLLICTMMMAIHYSCRQIQMRLNFN